MEVNYEKYCNKCVYKDTKEDDEPCNTCLLAPVNTGTEKPIKFVSSEGVPKQTQSYLDKRIESHVQLYFNNHYDEFKGPKGNKGEPGADGVTPNLTIGTVEILDVGTSATATITGDKENPVLNLGIPKGADGVSPTATVTKEGNVSTLIVTDKNSITSVEIYDGVDGKDSTGGSGNIASSDNNFRWKKVGVYHPKCQINYGSLNPYEVGERYTCLSYEVQEGNTLIKFSGACGGISNRCAYSFVDKYGNDLGHSEWTSMTPIDGIVPIPQGTYKVFINGSNVGSPYLEVDVHDEMGNVLNLSYLLNVFGRKLQYKDTFAWKKMPTGLIAFTFDDSTMATGDIVDLFIRKGVPCCFGAISGGLYTSLANGETIADAMHRCINTVGGEVLNHGGYLVTEDTINDEDFLFRKFVVDRNKFYNAGFDVRGILRTGGGGIDGDVRTDVWVRCLYDYSDLQGVSEPYNHPRVTFGTSGTLDKFKGAIDNAIANKTFAPLLFHQPPEYLEDLIDYAIEKGAIICTYAYAYDTYGSTQEVVSMLNRLEALENGTSEPPIEEKTLSSISATKTTTSYNVGDILNVNDINIIARYSDGTSEDVTTNAIVDSSSVNMSNAGTYNINVTYSEWNITKTTTINIVVINDMTGDTSDYLIYNGSFSGEALIHGDTFGSMIEVTSGTTYLIEADYEFTNTAAYASHTITLGAAGWSTGGTTFDSVDGTTSGHLSMEMTASSNGNVQLFRITLKNTTVSAYKFTNVYVNEVTS